MDKILSKMKASLPRYGLTQPSTGKTVSFRPFTVREEKTLIIANQTGSYEDFLITLSEIINECFDLPQDAKKLPIFDIEYFFIKIRSKSIGEMVEPIIKCPITNEEIKLSVNLDEIEPVFNSTHSKEIKLSNNILVKMKYPSLNDLIERKNSKIDYFDLLVDCIESIETDSEIVEAQNESKTSIINFIELLTDEQYKKLISFFKTTPKLEKEVSYITTDNNERKLTLRGLRDFFQ